MESREKKVDRIYYSLLLKQCSIPSFPIISHRFWFFLELLYLLVDRFQTISLFAAHRCVNVNWYQNSQMGFHLVFDRDGVGLRMEHVQYTLSFDANHSNGFGATTNPQTDLCAWKISHPIESSVHWSYWDQ